MYIETSYGSVGDRARLVSPLFQKVKIFLKAIKFESDSHL